MFVRLVGSVEVNTIFEEALSYPPYTVMAYCSDMAEIAGSHYPESGPVFIGPLSPSYLQCIYKTWIESKNKLVEYRNRRIKEDGATYYSRETSYEIVKKRD